MAGLAAALGSGAMTNSMDELEETDCILVAGSNTTTTHPLIAAKIRRAVERKGAKLIVVDPRKVELVRFAHGWLRPRPGTDVAWINGMLHFIFSEGLWDPSFVHEHCVGLEQLRETVRAYSPDKVEQLTGIPADDLVRAALVYARSPRAMILYTMGITQHEYGTDNVKSLANLGLACGQVGRPGTGINPLRGQNNVQGACDMGALPNVLPGYVPVGSDAVQARFGDVWGVGASLPGHPGLPATRMFTAARSGDVKAMYIMGENPVLSEADGNHVLKGLEQLDFLVVQDLFLTETARHAHVVLPGVSFAEKNGTFTNTERRVQRVRRGISPRNGFQSEWKIIAQLAENILRHRGNTGQLRAWSHDSAWDVFEEIRQTVPAYAGISYGRLEEEGGLQWPCPDVEHPGTRFLYARGFSRGKARMFPVTYNEPEEVPDAEYPLYLTTGRSRYHFHTGTMTRRSRGLDRMAPAERVEIHPDDAKDLGLTDGDLVRIVSRRGSVTARCVLTDRSAPGLVFATFHFSEVPINRLTSAITDNDSGIPAFKECAVRVEKVVAEKVPPGKTDR
ncbi:formate dehydrogenase subunit alpha [Desulfoplanes formicivorans]|uniref:nitrate reductase (cytochrome) n=1 Tax=Desulfoplanes formicivorans TaxID=1592317 RepID=A0A194AGA2_9BACT|nr:formate dehydrogenase subunit alpha [Desulfoplanes formicivorans]